MSGIDLPELPLSEWKDTLATLHMWSQIVGKIALAKSPLINHYWNATLRVTPCGLSTPALRDGESVFSFEFDLVRHRLILRRETGETREMELRPRSVADLYATVITALKELGIQAKIWTMPVEVSDPIKFTEDGKHMSYDREYVERFRTILVWVDGVFAEFRSRFLGKSSPVHFFWGSFDLAVTRFNGEKAPPRDGADPVTREAYSHACISHGFWCGGGGIDEPAFYAYAAPEPEGLTSVDLAPAWGSYDPGMKEFILLYETVRTSDDPKTELLAFMQSSYDAASKLAGWKRSELERTVTEVV